MQTTLVATFLASLDQLHDSTPFDATTMATSLIFSTFEVTRQAFHRTALAYAIVNLKPIVSGRTYRRDYSTTTTTTTTTSTRG